MNRTEDLSTLAFPSTTIPGQQSRIQLSFKKCVQKATLPKLFTSSPVEVKRTRTWPEKTPSSQLISGTVQRSLYLPARNSLSVPKQLPAPRARAYFARDNTLNVSLSR